MADFNHTSIFNKKPIAAVAVADNAVRCLKFDVVPKGLVQRFLIDRNVELFAFDEHKRLLIFVNHHIETLF